jgi:hypothetical protein
LAVGLPVLATTARGVGETRRRPRLEGT